MLAMRQLTAPRLKITTEEMRQAIESEYGDRVKARLIAVESSAVAKEVHAKALANPESFPDLSFKHSKDASVASAKGVIPPIRRYANDANFEEIAFSLKPGQISKIIPVGNMFYILKCEEILQGKKLTGPELAAVEKQLGERMKEQKMRTVAADMFKEMQTAAKVENIMNNPARAKEFPGVAAMVNGKPITMLQLGEECLARHGKEVLDGEINRRLLMQELTRSQKTVQKPDLDAEIARAAEMYGYLDKDNKTPDVNRWLNDVTKGDKSAVELYVRDAVWPTVALKKLTGDVKITDEDLKKGFESNYGEKVEILAIVLHDQRQAHKVWENARNNPTESYFAMLAEQYSVEQVSRGNGGKVPPIRKHSGQGEIETIAFQMKPGDLSPVVAVGNQFIIMRCQGRTKPMNVNFAQVRNEIYKDLEEQKSRLAMTQKFDELKEAAQIDNFLAGTTQTGRRGSNVRPASATSDAPARTTASPPAKAGATDNRTR
jgi:parvulin-like peptidyl-prolyl isomerase